MAHGELPEIKISVVIFLPNLANEFVAAAKEFAEPSGGSELSEFLGTKVPVSSSLFASKMDASVGHDELSETKIFVVVFFSKSPNKFEPTTTSNQSGCNTKLAVNISI